MIGEGGLNVVLEGSGDSPLIYSLSGLEINHCNSLGAFTLVFLRGKNNAKMTLYLFKQYIF